MGSSPTFGMFLGVILGWDILKRVVFDLNLGFGEFVDCLRLNLVPTLHAILGDILG